MAKFSEETLASWCRPPSESEATKLERAETMVRDAIKADPKLSQMNIEIFGQGSYANDTNVRNDSDIDINVCYRGLMYYRLPDDITREQMGFTNGKDYHVWHFKDDVNKALVRKFGESVVVDNDKCLTVLPTPTRVEADVVPTFEYRYYYDNKNYATGVKFFSNGNKEIINYPKTHIDNGKAKNTRTQKRFKRLTRIFRRIRYRMIDERTNVNHNITSFLLECLVYNIPDHILNDNQSWHDRLREGIIFLYNATRSENCNEWAEVSGELYLFKGDRKWTKKEVNEYLALMWNYLELA